MTAPFGEPLHVVLAGRDGQADRDALAGLRAQALTAPPEDPASMPPVGPQSNEHHLPKGIGPMNSSTTAVGYTCGGCVNRWSGVSRAHCASCHETFGGVDLFDRHRRDVKGEGTCLDPETIVSPKTGGREMFLTDGLWRSVETPAVSNLKNRKQPA